MGADDNLIRYVLSYMQATGQHHTLATYMQVARETYGCAPEVTCTGDLQSTIPYIPTHLDYMLYELLKNAMRCVLELCCLLMFSPELGVL